MVKVTAVPSLADRFRDHACQLAPSLYRSLLYEMAEDWRAGGIVASICRGWEDAPTGSVIQLRLLAGLHRLVLTGQAPELARYYPNLGGTAEPAGCWPQFRDVLATHADELREALLVAPQTNEPGRSVPLLVGLFEAARRSGLTRVRLLEPGASAGLNLLVDRYRIGGNDPLPWFSGPAESALRLDEVVIGPAGPVGYTITQRRGCDVLPVDATTAEGRLRLTSFVWPHHLDRHERLTAALSIAAQDPPVVDSAGAADWLAEQLAQTAEADVLTVVWHSVSRQYWPAEEATAATDVLAEAGERMPIAHICMEHLPGRHLLAAELTLDLRVPGTLAGGPVRLAEVGDHGVPTTLLRRGQAG